MSAKPEKAGSAEVGDYSLRIDWGKIVDLIEVERVSSVRNVWGLRKEVNKYNIWLEGFSKVYRDYAAYQILDGKLEGIASTWKNIIDKVMETCRYDILLTKDNHSAFKEVADELLECSCDDVGTINQELGRLNNAVSKIYSGF